MNDKLENFEQAFRTGGASCRRTCNCGKEYYDDVQFYDWEDGELERLRADKESVPLEYAPGDIVFEGSLYVDACSCWHKRAEQIMGFIDGHARQIAEYLKLEKQRKQTIADQSPVVE